MSQNQNSNEDFRVLITGEVDPGCIEAEVIEALAKIFNTDAEKIAALFAKAPTVLQKHYSLVQAEKVAGMLKGQGAVVEVISDAKWQRRVEDENAFRPAMASPQDTSNYDDDIWQQVETQNGDGLSYLKRYVGNNWHRYKGAFEKFESNADKPFQWSWHWPGFFVFFFWAVYRKMWWVAAIYFLLHGLLFSLSWSVVPLIYTELFTSLVTGVSAKYIYYRYAFWQRSRHQQESQATLRGGVSAIAIVPAVIVVMLFGPNVGKKLQSEYGQQLEALSLGMGTQTYGSGEVVGDINNLSVNDRRTFSEMSAYAKNFTNAYLLRDKILGEGQEFSAVNEGQVFNIGFPDVWGNDLRLISTASGFTLRSAGQDSVYFNDDDLLQSIDLILDN